MSSQPLFPIRKWKLACVCCLLLLSTTASRADFVIYKIPGTNVTVVFQGKVIATRTNPLLSVTINPKTTLDLPLALAEIVPLQTIQQISSRRVIKSKADAGALEKAADWALEHGELGEFHKAVDGLLALDATHRWAAKAKEIKDKMTATMFDGQAAITSIQGIRGNLQIYQTPHLVVGHDTPDSASIPRKKHIEARANQLEELFETYLMKCVVWGIPVQIPANKLPVVILSKTPPPSEADESRAPSVQPMSYWDQRRNVLILGDVSNLPQIDSLKMVVNELLKVQDQKANAKKNRPGGNLGIGAQPMGQPGIPGQPGNPGGQPQTNVLATMLAQMPTMMSTKLVTGMQGAITHMTDNLELEQSSREAAYFFSAATQVLPAGRPIPPWVRDGMAIYFEFPPEVGWVSLGDYSQRRKEWFLANLQDPNRVTFEQVVTCQLYDGPLTDNEAWRASTLSWSAFRFLARTRPEQLANYLQLVRQVPPDAPVSGDALAAMFLEAFGERPASLDKEWTDHMLALQPCYRELAAEAASGEETTN